MSTEGSNTEDDEEDPYDARIKKSGCAKYHYALQDCYAENRDWRKCKKEMEDFKKCFEKNKSSPKQFSSDHS